MILETLGILGGLTYTIAKTEQGSRIDANAQKKYAKAFERQEQAEELIRAKKEATDMALLKAANRKKSILCTSMQDFLDLYDKIMQITFSESQGISELKGNLITPQDITSLRYMTNFSLQPMTDKDVVFKYLLVDVGRSIVDDAKRRLDMANSQMKISNVVYSQAQTISISLDAVIERCNRIALILAKLDLLFSRTIKESKIIIEKNDYQTQNYSDKDLGVIQTCVNFAHAIKQILDVPLIEKDGQLTQCSLDAIKTGEEYLRKIGNI